MKTFSYARGQQTLCVSCRRRVESNGQRFIHLVIYGNNEHEAIPDSDLICDKDDPWEAEKLRLMEAPEE